MNPAHDAAIADFHALIEDDLAGAEAQVESLMATQRERGILFGNRIAARSLRPTFLTEATYGQIQDACFHIRAAIQRIGAAHFHDPAVLTDGLGLRDWELELVSIPTRTVDTSTLARLDSFLTEDGFQFVEVNGESPAGMGYLHELALVYEQLPIFQRFAEMHPVRFVSPLEHTAQMLLRTYHGEHGGRVPMPTVAIVDRLDIPTLPEFRIVKAYLERHGVPCILADPRALELGADGFLYAEGRRIDVLYKRVLVNDLWAMRDDCRAFFEGYRSGQTCVVNSLRGKIAHKKAIFALLTDPVYADRLSATEQETIRRHVPWTRRLREGTTTDAEGRSVDLVAHVRANRNGFVIKPNDEYGGAGVTLGFEQTDAGWDDALAAALTDGDCVVQATVRIRREPFRVQGDDGAWHDVPTVIDLDPYLFGPLVGGCLARTSSTNLANVTAGGGTLPVFLLRGTDEAHA